MDPVSLRTSRRVFHVLVLVLTLEKRRHFYNCAVPRWRRKVRRVTRNEEYGEKEKHGVIRLDSPCVWTSGPADFLPRRSAYPYLVTFEQICFNRIFTVLVAFNVFCKLVFTRSDTFNCVLSFLARYQCIITRYCMYVCVYLRLSLFRIARDFVWTYVYVYIRR